LRLLRKKGVIVNNRLEGNALKTINAMTLDEDKKLRFI